MVTALLPQGFPIPPGSRESARLQALLLAAEHLRALPARGATSDDLLRRGAALRAQAAETLAILGKHAAAEMPAALHRATAHWEQAGNVTLLTPEGRAAALALQEAVQHALDALLAVRERTPGAVAFLGCAAEAMTAVDSACTLLRAMEVRFAPLLRERLRQLPTSASPADQREALLPGNIPFLPVGEALLGAAVALGFCREGPQGPTASIKEGTCA